MDSIIDNANSLLDHIRATRTIGKYSSANLHLSEETVSALDALPDSPAGFIKNALQLWIKCGYPWFSSGSRPRVAQKQVAYNKSFFKEVADKFEEQRLNASIFIDEVVYQYIHGATDGLKPVIDDLKSLYSDNEKKVTFVFAVTQSVSMLSSAKAKEDGLKRTRVLEALIRAWVDAGCPKLEPRIKGGVKTAIRTSVPQSVLEKFESGCKQTGMSHQKVMDTLLLAWVTH